MSKALTLCCHTAFSFNLILRKQNIYIFSFYQNILQSHGNHKLTDTKKTVLAFFKVQFVTHNDSDLSELKGSLVELQPINQNALLGYNNWDCQ